MAEQAQKRSGRGGKNSQFLGKLIEMLENQSNHSIIKYDKRRKHLIVYQKNKLELILPLYFKHSNFQSFARQLNWFGFSKVRGGHHHIFKHSELKKGKKLCQLKSKRKNKGLQSTSYDSADNIPQNQNPQARHFNTPQNQPQQNYHPQQQNINKLDVPPPKNNHQNQHTQNIFYVFYPSLQFGPVLQPSLMFPIGGYNMIL